MLARAGGRRRLTRTAPPPAAQAIATLNNTELGGRSILVRLERGGGERPAKAPAATSNGTGRKKTAGAGSIVNSGRPQNSSGLQARAPLPYEWAQLP